MVSGHNFLRAALSGQEVKAPAVSETKGTWQNSLESSPLTCEMETLRPSMDSRPAEPRFTPSTNHGRCCSGAPREEGGMRSPGNHRSPREQATRDQPRLPIAGTRGSSRTPCQIGPDCARGQSMGVGTEGQPPLSPARSRDKSVVTQGQHRPTGQLVDAHGALSDPLTFQDNWEMHMSR